MIFALSVMLWFEGIPEPDTNYWQHKMFATQTECHEYLALNKVNIVDNVLKNFREVDGNKLINFEFFCESKTYTLEI